MKFFYSLLLTVNLFFYIAPLTANDICPNAEHNIFDYVNHDYSEDLALSNNSVQYYYFETSGAGLLTFEVTGDVSSYGYSYSKTGCPSTTTAIANGETIEIGTDDLNLNFRVIANKANKNISISFTFIPSPETTPPTISNIPNQFLEIGTPFTLNLSVYTHETDGDSIEYNSTGALPSWLSFDGETGRISGTPDVNATWNIDVNATDKDGTSNNVTITFTTDVTSGPPIMAEIPDQDIPISTPFDLNISQYASKVDSDIVSYTLTGTIPSGLDFNTTTGVLKGTPTLNGNYSLSAFATDGEGPSNIVDFNITVSNTAAESDLLIVKTASKKSVDVNQSITYYITIANETSTNFTDVNITDTLFAFNYFNTNKTRGSEVTGLDFNLTVNPSQGSFNCGTVNTNATSFKCTGSVPKRTGNGGVPGLARIVYTITSPNLAPGLLYNEVVIDGTSTDANESVTIISGSGGGGTYLTPPPEYADLIDSDEWSDEWKDLDDYNKVIKTKIASQAHISMTAVHLDGNKTASVYTTVGSSDDDDLSFLVIPYLSDGSCTTQEILYDSDTGNPTVFNITDGNAIDTKNITIPSKARKNARISISYLDLDQLFIDSGVKCAYSSSTTGNLAGLGQCVNSANNYYDAFGLSAFERCQTLNGKPCESTNHGESNPSDPTYNPLYDNELGCLMCTLNAFPDCSSDNFAIRPNDFNSTITANQVFLADQNNSITFRADQHSGIGTPDYNEDMNISFVLDINISDSTKVCEDMSININPGVNFIDGNVTNNYSFNNVGKFDLIIYEPANATYEEFAVVDKKDSNNIQRLITPFTTQIEVIPHHLEIDGNLSNGSTGFTYLNNFEGNASLDQNISALLSWDVIAKGETNVTTTNYTNTCYAKDGNITLTLALSQTLLDLNNSLSKLLWYDANDTLILDAIPLASPIEGPYVLPDYTKDRFVTGDNNGTGKFTYRLNFDRNVTKVVNPFRMSVSNLRVDDNDSVDGNASLDNNATYVYGVTYAGKQRYDTAAGTPNPANIYYAIYCFNTTGIGPCNTSLLPPTLRTSDIRWYQNTNHNTLNDGNITIVVQKGGTNVDANDIVDASDNPAGNPATTNISYDGSRGYPYRTTMQDEANSWLIYNENDPAATRNEFQVEFYNIGTWAGERETTTTTKDPGTAKTNRRSMW